MVTKLFRTDKATILKGFYVSSLSKIILKIGQFWKFALVAPSENQPESHSSAILFADMQFFCKSRS